MRAPPEAGRLAAFLARVARRRSSIAAAQGAAVGLASAAALLVSLWTVKPSHEPGWLLSIGAGLALLGTSTAMLGSRGSRRRIALLVEARAPQSRNLVVTAAELMEEPGRARTPVAALVCSQAETLVAALEPAALFPARRALLALGAATALFVLIVWLAIARPGTLGATTRSGSFQAAVGAVEVTVSPPAYTGLAQETVRDPVRIQAMAGSVLRLNVHARADAITIETLPGRQSLAARESQTFVGQVRADADGYVAIEPVAADGRKGPRRLIGLTVTADRPPRVRVTAPGRDLFLADVRRTVPVTIEADDDLGLAQLQLRYTRVSGSGERFAFAEGVLPLQIERTNQKAWRARAELKLETLGLLPGDMLVYRGAARDQRPGALATESDAFIVEITTPGAMAAEGFAIDDEDRDRYGISQQMVVLKTERLLARASALSPDSLARAALALAAEQRSVRAEFVFMMGGELAEEVLEAANLAELNEEEHAAADEEVLAGRLANRGRIELMRAIRAMSHASTALNATNLNEALKQERTALTHLQGAFARTRYILRALTQRERLDLSRRLTGALGTAGSHLRAVPEPETDARMVALRQTLSGIAALAAQPLEGHHATLVSTSAQNLLRVDPSHPRLQRVSALLAEAATDITQNQMTAARSRLERAASSLAMALEEQLPATPRTSASLDLKRLEGALLDALRPTTTRRP
jgi:hypothetical protein